MAEKKDMRDLMMTEQDNLWSRITALAEEEDISYLEATEKCVKDYWKDFNLRKEA